jgi:exonuclease SbcC
MDNRTKAERALNKAKQALIDLKRDTSIALDEVEKCKVDAENLLDKVDDLMAISQWREKWLANKRGFTNQLKMDADSMNLAEEKVRLISQQMELRHNHLVMMKSTQDILLAMMPEWIGMDTSCYAVEGTVAPDVLAAGWTALQNNVRKWKTEIDTLSKQINGYNDSLMRFYNDNPEVDEPAVLRLMEFSPYQIAEMEERHQRMEQSIASFKGQIKQLTEKRTHLDENRPDINPDDTVESLKELARSCETSMLHKQQEMGGLRNQLNEDSRKRQNKETALKQFEILKMDAQNWKLFNDEFGSADGSKFRKIAQSFLLNHLLVKANSYLRHFTDRYEMVGEPGSLAILVSDRYTKLPPQYVKILSGGETFMVSLSLALALAQLNDTPSAVDTIFIDEGFGSLDPQSLSDVMDTLEKLHQIGGRRVGIISHVEELKRRIAVQVNVQRVDPTRSKVTITS